MRSLSAPTPSYADRYASDNPYWTPLTSPDNANFVAVNPFRISRPPPREGANIPPSDTTVNAWPSKGSKPLQLWDYITAAPLQLYMCILLQLPSMYWTRVARIFEEAELSIAHIEQMVLNNLWKPRASKEREYRHITLAGDPAFKDLDAAWKAFVDALLREWKTLNLVSVLLLTLVSVFHFVRSRGLTVLGQCDSYSAPDRRCLCRPRNSELCFAVISVCVDESPLWMYVYHSVLNYERTTQSFRMGRGKSSKNAGHSFIHSPQQAQKTAVVWWNVWILLAMPSIWLSWCVAVPLSPSRVCARFTQQNQVHNPFCTVHHVFCLAHWVPGRPHRLSPDINPSGGSRVPHNYHRRACDRHYIPGPHY